MISLQSILTLCDFQPETEEASESEMPVKRQDKEYTEIKEQ